MNSSQHQESIAWAVFFGLSGIGFEVLAVFALIGNDRIVKTLYRVYREQWVKDPMDSVRDKDTRLLYGPFRYLFYIVTILFGLILIAACIASILK